MRNIELFAFGRCGPEVLCPAARRVYETAANAGWYVPSVAVSRWAQGDTEHSSTGFGLVDPTDGHGEAFGIWTDGRWDNGMHLRVGAIGARALKALAELPPGHYIEDGEADAVQV